MNDDTPHPPLTLTGQSWFLDEVKGDALHSFEPGDVMIWWRDAKGSRKRKKSDERSGLNSSYEGFATGFVCDGVSSRWIDLRWDTRFGDQCRYKNAHDRRSVWDFVKKEIAEAAGTIVRWDATRVGYVLHPPHKAE